MLFRTLLIIDSDEAERSELINLLGNNYIYSEAENTWAALEILDKNYTYISAMLLDMSTQADKGFELLSEYRRNKLWGHIPVIAVFDSAAESMNRAYELGAAACIKRPHENELLPALISNLIRMCESSADAEIISRDKVTDLISREVFCAEAHKMIKKQKAGYYVLSCLNVQNFKIINDQYGMEKGDAVLRYIGGIINKSASLMNGLCCRYMADKFALLYTVEYMDSDITDLLHKEAEYPDCINKKINIRFGRYIVDDITMPIGNIYERAAIAEASISDKYGAYYAIYDESMRTRLLAEHQIVADMNDALENGEFEVWLQPQYNHATGELIGAEALARWRKSADESILNPFCFISVFEQNGFIYELDKAIWEQVCALLRRWYDKGYDPLPISVNISRYDIHMPDFIDVLTGLISKYKIKAEMLRLEITESAVIYSTDKMLAVLKKLIALGFTIEIDDFGSGYSSLNTLKDVPAHIIKLDMKFLQTSDDSRRGGIILESVVRMAKWLDMIVIAEGVETIEQAEFLRSIGCLYVQGYLYAKPMPVHEYENLAKSTGNSCRLDILRKTASLNNSLFWEPQSIDALIFNTYIDGACVFEAFNDRIALLRINDKFIQVIGNSKMTTAEALKLDLTAYLDEEGTRSLFSAIRRSLKLNEEVKSEYVFYNLPGRMEITRLKINLRVITYTGNRLLIFCTIEDVTEQRLAEANEKRNYLSHKQSQKKLKTIINNINAGISATIFIDDKLEYLFANNKYYSIFGYTKDQFYNELDNGIIDLVSPDYLSAFYFALRDKAEKGGQTNIKYKARKRDGSELWVCSSSTICSLEDIDRPVFATITTDITERIKDEIKHCHSNNKSMYPPQKHVAECL